MNNQISKWMIMAGIAGATLAFGLGTVARAAPTAETTDETMPNGKAGSELIHATAKVTAINHGARTVTLMGEDGNEITVDVPPDSKAYDKLKVGDQVDIDYFQSLAVSMMPAGTKTSMTERKVRTVDLKGGVTGREVTVAAQVVSVDTAANTVTIKGPHGQVRTVHVADPALQQKLPTVKPGQVVQLDYTEATAASIRPSSK